MSYFGSAVLLDEAARADITRTLTRDWFYRRRALPKHCYSIIEVDYGGGGTVHGQETINLINLCV